MALLFSVIIIINGYSILLQDAEFCRDREQWTILEKHKTAIRDSALISPSGSRWVNVYLDIAENELDSIAVLDCLYRLATKYADYERAVQWVELASNYSVIHPGFTFQSDYMQLLEQYSSDADRFILKAYNEKLVEDSLYAGIAKLEQYNPYVEELAKNYADIISTEHSDTLANALIDKFYSSFPHSQWKQAVYYFELARLSSKSDLSEFFLQLDNKSKISTAHSYISSMFLLSPNLRRRLSQNHIYRDPVLEASDLLERLDISHDTLRILYDVYEPAHWLARLHLQKGKAAYYHLLQKHKYYGDEDSLVCISSIKADQIRDIFEIFKNISFKNNNNGEQAELLFWKGKVLALSSDRKLLKQSAIFFTQCLVKGAPRKKYDSEACSYLAAIHKKLRIRDDLISWQRQLMRYTGLSFTDITESSGLSSRRETRVALGDYDNDSYCDILLNGKKLYRNNGDLTFTDFTDSLGLSELNANGGLWADFNLDGILDFMTISHADEGNGERLMKNNGNRFIRVNERSGDIDDTYPTEGAAWIDCFHDNYPDLYCANYEKWNIRSGYEDRFWSNDKGYFQNKTAILGFIQPEYARNPGQAGRGVAPADFDNDGDQEIFVTNYRLDRNFLWDKQDSIFIEIAALNGLQGKLKKGYYGHSIGADWGDFDNDGDLDLFVANLAHPRYIDISDISMLLRNDGLQNRVIAGDTITYWQFTDITQESGITYDELHSDPLWFDADNDGFLDLFITSVYENDRSYLYHNNGNGTFTDISWLSGTRTYNGWGNACADLDHDGKLDLVVGSGNGIRVFHNTTNNQNKSIFIKPIWENGAVTLLDNWKKQSLHPNSPAYGTRITLSLKTPKGKSIKLSRELSSAKGTTSQSDQWLHFGLGKNRLIRYSLFNPKDRQP